MEQRKSFFIDYFRTLFPGNGGGVSLYCSLALFFQQLPDSYCLTRADGMYHGAEN
jgi:hypothetical protein